MEYYTRKKNKKTKISSKKSIKGGKIRKIQTKHIINTKNNKKNQTKFTKLNCLLVRKLLSIYYKKKIIYKKPNDLLIDKKKICGILQETLIKFNKKYLIVGIGINLIKNPYIKNYPTTNLYELMGKKVSKSTIEHKLKKIFELKLSKLYKLK